MPTEELIGFLFLVYYVCSVASMMNFWTDEDLDSTATVFAELLLSPFLYPIWAIQTLRMMHPNERPAVITIHVFLVAFFIVVGFACLG